MASYLIIATVGAALSYAAEKCDRRLLKELIYAALVIFFAALAGFRDLSVGTDTAGYGVESYQIARLFDFWSFYKTSAYSTWSPFAKILVWATSNLFGSVNAPLTAIGALVFTPFLCSARIELQSYTPFAVFLFGIAFFPMSLNMMRQMVAMSFLLLAYALLKCRGIVSFGLAFSCALLFHSSALVGLVILPVVIYAEGKGFSGGVKYILICMVAVVFAVFSTPLIRLFSAATGLFGDYVDGSQHMAGGGTRTLMITYGVFSVLFILGLLFSIKKVNIALETNISLIALVTIGVVLLPLSLWTFYLYRIGMIFIYFSVLLIPYVASQISDRNTRLFFVAVAVFLFVLWSFDYYCIQHSHEVIPYLLCL